MKAQLTTMLRAGRLLLCSVLISTGMLAQQPPCVTISDAASTTTNPTPNTIAFSPLLPGATNIYAAIGTSNSFTIYAVSPSSDSVASTITSLSSDRAASTITKLFKPQLGATPVISSVAFSPTIPSGVNAGSALLAVAETSPATQVSFYTINYAGNKTALGLPFILPDIPSSVAFSPVLAASNQILVAVALKTTNAIDIYSYSLTTGLVMYLMSLQANATTIAAATPTSVAFSPLLTTGSYATLLAIAAGNSPNVTIYGVDQLGNFSSTPVAYPSTDITGNSASYVAFSPYLTAASSNFALGITNSGITDNIGVYSVTNGGAFGSLSLYTLPSALTIGFSPLLSNGDVLAAVSNPLIGYQNVELFSVSNTATLTPLSCGSINPLTAFGTTSFSTPSAVAFSPLFANGTSDLGITDVGNNMTYFFSFNPSCPVATLAACATSVCCGESLDFTITITGGTPPYSFLFAGNQATIPDNLPHCFSVEPCTNEPLPATTSFSVTNITDCNGCPGADSATVAITINEVPLVTLTPNQTSYCTGNNVIITATPIAGATYSWQVNGVPSTETSNTLTLTDTAAGTYDIEVTVAANGCSDTVSLSVVVNPLPVVTISANQTSYCTGQTVLLTANVQGGTAPFTYTWYQDGSPIPGDVTASVTGLAAGSYNFQLSLTDANGCMAVSQILPVTVNSSATSVTLGASPAAVCAGSPVTLTVTITGGTAPYNFVLDGTMYTMQTSPATISVTPTATTCYQVTNVVDSNGCPGPDSTSEPVTVNPTATVAIQPNQTTYCAGTTASFTAIVSGATATSYTWTLDAEAPVTTTVPYFAIPGADVTLGSHVLTLSVDLSDMCSTTPATYTFTVNSSPTTVTLTPSASEVCAGSPVTLTVTITGGTAPYSFILDGTTYTDQTSPATISVTPTETTCYQVTGVVDANGCTGPNSTSEPVTVNPTATVMIQPNQTTYCAGTTASFTAIVSGATATSYTWTLDAEAPVTTTVPYFAIPSADVTVGSHTLTLSVDLTDMCSTTPATYTFTVNSSPTSVTLGASPAAVCAGSPVTLTVTITGGTAPYNFVLDGTMYTMQTSPATISVTPTATTCYQVTNVVDSNGCPGPDSTSEPVTVNPTATVAIQPNQTTYCAGTTASFTAIVSGATATSYTWTLDAEAPVTTTVPYFAIPGADVTLGSHVLTLSVDLSDMCSTTPATYTFTVNSSPTTVTLTPSASEVCAGSPVTLTVTITGGTAPYSFILDGTTYTMQTSPATISVTPTATTCYQVTAVVDSNGCTGPNSTSEPVTVNPTATVMIQPNQTTYCAGTTASFTAIVSGATATSYTWTLDAEAPVTTTVPYFAIPSADLTVGTHTLTLSVDLSDGCPTTPATYMFTVNSTATTSLTVSSPALCGSGSVTFTVTFTGGTAPFTFELNGMAEMSTGSSTTITVPVTTTECWQVTNVVDTNHCPGANSNTVLVEVNPALDVSIVPNQTSYCQGKDVILTANVTSGTAPFTYTWTVTPAGTQIDGTYIIPNAPAGTVTAMVAVTDANGCSGTSTMISVPVNPTPSITLSATSPVCNGQPIVVTATTTPTATSIMWIVNGKLSTTQMGTTFILLPADQVAGINTFVATVVDATGCMSTSSQLNVLVDAAVTGSILSTQPSYCAGQTIIVVANPLTGTPPFSYMWSVNGAQVPTPTPPSILTVPNATAGTYNFGLTLTDAEGCTNSVPIMTSVVVNAMPVVTISGNTSYCIGGTIQLTAQSTGTIQSVVWSTPNRGTITGATLTLNNAQPADAGTYTATVTNTNGCTGTASYTITVTDCSALCITQKCQLTACCTESFVITVANTGTGVAQNVVIQDILPANLSFVSAYGAPYAVSGNVVTATVPMIAPGASVKLLVRAQIRSSAIGTNIVKVTHTGGSCPLQSALSACCG